MKRRGANYGLALLLATVVAVAAPRGAAAQGPNDEVVDGAISDIMDNAAKTGEFASAVELLEATAAVCEGRACSKKMSAKLDIAIGTAHARAGSSDQAEKSFKKALRGYSKSTLIAKYVTGDVRRAFLAVAAEKQKAQSEGCRASYKRGVRGRGWRNPKAYHCYRQAQRQRKRKQFEGCVDDVRASLDIEKRAGTRVVIAQCLEGANNWTEAISEYEEVSRQAPRERQFRLARNAKQRAAQLRRRMPVLIIKTPQGASPKLEVKLDGTILPPDVYGEEYPLDPGGHRIEASDGALKFESNIELEPSKVVTVPVALSPPNVNSRELECILSAGDPDELAKCLGLRRSQPGSLNTRVGAELSGYHDTLDVDVLTPSISARVEDPLSGWVIGAGLLVDVVTAASTDIIATASPQWTEVRFVPGLNGHKRFDDVDVRVSGSLSHEPDYLSATIAAGASIDLRQKTITPSLGYSYSHDVNGRADTSFEAFSLLIDRHALDLGLGLVLTKATFGSANFTMVFEDGDTSKPYRHIPMFEPAIASQIFAGFPIESVNIFRAPPRPLEQLPTTRKRFGIALSLAHRFASSTLRASERVYFDSWGVAASTTDARFMYDVLKELRIWPHLRFHGQGGANFYELAYEVVTDGDTVLMPALRTGDRELGPLVAVTFGGGARYDFGPRKAYGIMLSGDVVYTKFLNHLFVVDRYGYFGALGFEAKFE